VIDATKRKNKKKKKKKGNASKLSPDYSTPPAHCHLLGQFTAR
jgi:hypothetical protein